MQLHSLTKTSIIIYHITGIKTWQFFSVMEIDIIQNSYTMSMR